MEKSTVKPLGRAAPEELGLSSRALIDWLDDMRDNKLEFHSFMVLRHGKVAAEGYFYPYNAETPHALYSFSKSFTSTAVGFAIDEGLFGLDTTVAELLDDISVKKNKEHIQKLTVRDLLRMRSGLGEDIIGDKAKFDWIKHFLEGKNDSAPGEKWFYNNMCPYLLSYALTRKTGMPLVDYLMPRLFGPLGIERPVWEESPDGTEAGGWGLYLKTEDLARFMLCYHQKGVWEGKQVIPARWAAEAVKLQGDTVDNRQDFKCGYGYYFWRGSTPNTYRADGLFSQHGIVFEDYDAVIVYTAAVPSEQAAIDSVLRHFPAAFKEGALPGDDEAHNEMNRRISCLSLEKLPASGKNEAEKLISGKTYKTKKAGILRFGGQPFSILPMPVTFMMGYKAGNPDNVRFDFKDGYCIFSWDEGDGKEKNSIPIGMDGEFRTGKMRLADIDFTAVSGGCWHEDGTLELWIRVLETISMRVLKFKFDGNRFKAKTDSVPSIKDMLSGISDNMDQLFGKFLGNIIARVLMFFAPYINATLRGFRN
ncbi:MAG: beta-lactamase family protein [Oscillospiraceae bacterium]|nr:beta-lactamase family protein [Oscillospiraceae bacterium]